MLSDSEAPSDTESLHNLTINEHYAKAFQYKKEREELQKLKEEYGSNPDEDEGEDETDSESDQSEDEDGQELTPNVDAAILKTLARIMRKDPAIYDANKNIFIEEKAKSGSIIKHSRPSKDKSKPITIRQVALQSTLNPTSRSPSPEPLPHIEEQRVLRSETVAAFHETVTLDDDDDFLVLRETTRDEQALEEEKYRAFLEREVGGDLALVTNNEEEIDGEGCAPPRAEKGTKEKQKKQIRGTDQVADAAGQKILNQQSDQDFLINYILNRGWIDRSARRIPTYQEVTHSKSLGKKKAEKELASESFEEDEQFLADPDVDEEDFEEIVDRFESSYNFRFEEPEAASIKSYPRQMASLVRREENPRKAARERKKQRKEEQMQQKKDEIKRLKNLKMKEIRSKLERIRREGGKNVEDDALQALDLEGDWDPEAYDRQMAHLYGNEDLDDEEKPHWNEDIDIGDIQVAQTSTTSKKKKKKKKGNDNDGVETLPGVDVDAMDADVEKVVDDEEWDGTEEMRKRKLDKYMDEIYGLEFNDMIGDMTTRFKYIPVQPQSYNLTPVEILMATDQELNEYMSVKKYAPYRKEAKWDAKRNERLGEFKSKLGQRISGNTGHGDIQGGMQEEGAKKQRKGKKERMKMKAAVGDVEKDKVKAAMADQAATTTAEPQTRKRKRDTIELGGASEIPVANGKRKRRRHKDKKEGTF